MTLKELLDQTGFSFLGPPNLTLAPITIKSGDDSVNLLNLPNVFLMLYPLVIDHPKSTD